MLRSFLHYGIHFIVPFIIGYFFFSPEKRKRVILILLAGILIDIDHLWATPIFDSNRCSIGFHFMHQYWAIGVYIFLTLQKKYRIFGLALLLHILADGVDCYANYLGL